MRMFGVAVLVTVLAGSSAFGSRPESIQPKIRRASFGSSSDALSAKDRVEVFEEIWKTVNEKYYDPAFNGVNWRAVRESYRPRIDQASSDEDFFRLLKQMVGELKDAHTRFATPEERRAREREQAVSAGLTIFEVEGKPVIISVDPDSDASRAGIEGGMIVVTIDGKPVADRLAEARARVAGSSTDRAVRLRIYRMIVDGDPGTILKISLARADGSTLEASLARRIVRDVASVMSKRLPSGLGYIKLTLWKSPVRKQFKNALKQMSDAPGLIIDLRGNPGGEAEEVVKIASYFFDSHVSFGKFSSRSGRAIFLRTDEDENGFKGPIAILVNEGSGSGSELFAGVMQEKGRAVVVGRRSCGCVLGISKFRKFGGGELAISEYGYVSPGGKTFEGSGIVPNKEVELSIADLRQHRDTALEEAERLLARRSQAHSGVHLFALDKLTRFAINR